MDLASDGNTGPVTARYGAWPSPIGASDVAVAGIRLSGPVPVHTDAGDEVWWAEARPADGGRIVVVRRDAAGTVCDVLPAGWNVRTRVHEYGGRPGSRCPAAGWSSRTGPTSGSTGSIRARRTPVPLTPEPAETGRPAVRGPGARPGRRRGLVGARGARRGHGSRRHLVAVPLSGAAAADPRGARDRRRQRLPRLAATVAGRAAGGLDRLGPPADAVGRHRAAGRRARPGRHRGVGRRPCSAARPSRCCSRSGPTPTRCRWSATAPAGGTCTGCRPPVARRSRCARGRRSSALRCGVLGATSYAPLGDGRLAVLHGTDTLALGMLDPAPAS